MCSCHLALRVGLWELEIREIAQVQWHSGYHFAVSNQTLHLRSGSLMSPVTGHEAVVSCLASLQVGQNLRALTSLTQQ